MYWAKTWKMWLLASLRILWQFESSGFCHYSLDFHYNAKELKGFDWVFEHFKLDDVNDKCWDFKDSSSWAITYRCDFLSTLIPRNLRAHDLWNSIIWRIAFYSKPSKSAVFKLWKWHFLSNARNWQTEFMKKWLNFVNIRVGLIWSTLSYQFWSRTSERTMSENSKNVFGISVPIIQTRHGPLKATASTL